MTATSQLPSATGRHSKRPRRHSERHTSSFRTSHLVIPNAHLVILNLIQNPYSTEIVRAHPTMFSIKTD